MRTFFAVVCFVLTMASAQAAHTQARLILADDLARPGETVLVGVHLKMEPGWHTYWKNPGEAGMATKIVWHLPQGVTAGDIQWPLPEKLPPAEVTTYGYDNEVMLLVPLKLAAVPSANPAGPAPPKVTLAYVAGGRGLAVVLTLPTRSWASGPAVSFSGQKSSGELASTALS